MRRPRNHRHLPRSASRSSDLIILPRSEAALSPVGDARRDVYRRAQIETVSREETPRGLKPAARWRQMVARRATEVAA